MGDKTCRIFLWFVRYSAMSFFWGGGARAHLGGRDSSSSLRVGLIHNSEFRFTFLLSIQIALPFTSTLFFRYPQDIELENMVCPSTARQMASHKENHFDAEP